MLIKSKDIAPDSQAAAWVVAVALGYDVFVNWGRVFEGKECNLALDQKMLDHLSPEVVLEVMEQGDVALLKLSNGQWAANNNLIGIKPAGLGDTIPLAVISCLLMTRESWDVPGELI